MRRLSLLVLLLFFALAPTCEGAPRKKLIEMGWDEPDPAFMRAHLAQLEAAPFDGCVYHLPYPDTQSLGRFGKPQDFAWAVWGTRTFREDELAPALADLRATPFRKLRWNFLRVNVTPGTLDWFDDHAAVMSNLRLGASVARRAGSAGVLFDTEQYQGHLFEYPTQRDAGTRSYAEYAEQARRRGREAMRALEQGYPGLTVFVTLAISYSHIVAYGDRARLEKQPYGLLVPFIDGMISAASDSARIVDGMEASYPAREPQDLDKYFDVQTDLVLPWVSSPAKYRRVVSRSFGIWLDFDSPRRPWIANDPNRNYRPPAKLRALVQRALQLSDEYVWVYSERPLWWTKEGKRRDVPSVYDRALRDARRGGR